MGAPLYVTFGVNVKPVKSRLGGPVTGPRVTAPVGDLLTGVGVIVIVPVGVVRVGGFCGVLGVDLPPRADLIAANTT